MSNLTEEDDFFISEWYAIEGWSLDDVEETGESGDSYESQIERLLSDLAGLMSTAEANDLRIEATEAEWEPIQKRHDEIFNSLQGKPSIGQIQSARGALPEIGGLMDVARQQVQVRLGEEAENIREKLKEYEKPPEAEEEEWAGVRSACEEVKVTLQAPILKKAIVGEAGNQAEAVKKKVEEARLLVAARLERWRLEAAELVNSLSAHETPDPNAEASEWQEITNACGEIRRQLGGALDAELLKEAANARDQIPGKVSAAKQIVQLRLDRAVALVAEITPEKGALSLDPAGALPGQISKLKGARDAVRSKAEVKPFTQPALVAAEEARLKLDELLKAVAKEIESAGGAEELGQLVSALGTADDVEKVQAAFGLKGLGEVKTLVAEFGGKENLKKLIDTFKPPTALAKLSGNLGGPKCMEALLNNGCGGAPEKLDQFQKAFGGNFTKLGGMLEKGGLKNHPKALAALFKTGTGGDPKEFKLLCDNYSGEENLTNLGKLLNEGGFGAKPECLGQTLATGVSGTNTAGKAGSLKTLAKTLSESGTLPKLSTLISEEGGLGDNPEVFGQFLKVGCGGKPNSLKGLLQTFDNTALGKLNGLVKSAGFGNKNDPEVKPGCLGQLMATGCNGNPADMLKLCNKLSVEDHTNLKSLMKAGGLGAEPEVLGHLVKTGCPNKPEGGEWDLQKFGKEFAKNPADLKELLTTGGFAVKTDKPAVKPESLANLLGVGCDGDPVKLKALATTTRLPKIKEILQTGGLGERPEALGHAYKLGCSQDPGKFEAIHTEFNGSGGKKLGRLADLMESANFKMRPEMLGEILGTGCGGNAANLKDMAVAFQGTKMPHLKEMVDEWGANSGTAIKTLTGPRHLNGDFKKLETKFSSTLRADFPPPDRNRHRKALIKLVPNFKRKEFNPNTLNGSLGTPLAFTATQLGGFTGTDPRHLVAHVCERHLPSHFAFKDPKASFEAINFSNTQFPESTTPQQVADIMKAAIISQPGQTALQQMKVTADNWSQDNALRNEWLDHKNWVNQSIGWEQRQDYNYWFENEGGRLWTTYQRILQRREKWNSRIPDDPGPPPYEYNRFWPTTDPGDEPYDPGYEPDDPGPPPKPQRDFTHAGIKFRVGVSFKNGAWGINQFFPISGPNLDQFDNFEMESLRDALIA